MPVGTAIGVGGLVGGYLLSKRKKKNATPKPADAQPIVPAPTAAQQVAATNPVQAVKEESANVAQAQTMAMRTRRRAAAGNSGLAGGARPASQRTPYQGSGPRTLIGS